MKEQIEKQAIEEMARFMLEKSNSANVEPIFMAEDGTEIVLDEKATKLLDVILEQAFIPFLAENLYNENYRKQSELTPCDVCKFGPPSGWDGKPCCSCPAQMKGGE